MSGGFCCLCPGQLSAQPYLLLAVGSELAQSQQGRLRVQVRTTANSSEHGCTLLTPSTHVPIVPKNSITASLLNSSSGLASILCISNLWLLKQLSIRSSFKRCFCSCSASSVYTEAALLFLLQLFIPKPSVKHLSSQS